MKCKLCGKKTDWNSSYGRPKFIVCSTCYKRIVNIIKVSTNYEYSNVTAQGVILEMGFIKEEAKK